MSSRADMYRRRAVDAKNRATQAKDLFIKSAFEHVAAGWVALAQQAERIDREKFPVRDEKKSLGPLTEHDGDIWEYILIITVQRHEALRRRWAERPIALSDVLRGREPCGSRSAGRCVQPRSDCRHRTPQ